MKKYTEILDKPYKKEMLSNIKEDLKSYYPEMEDKELVLLANEIYSICVSLCYRINLEKIVELLYRLDNSYYSINKSTSTGIIESAINDNNMDYLRIILNKYTKEVEKRK